MEGEGRRRGGRKGRERGFVGFDTLLQIYMLLL